jgi:type IX secretion system PorP/SprF family membrane protein
VLKLKKKGFNAKKCVKFQISYYVCILNIHTLLNMFTKTLNVSKTIALAATGLLLCFSAKAQDIHFSQIFENPLSLNPSLCGAYPGNFLAEINYRNQWNSVAQNGNGYTTEAATMEFHNMLKSWGSGYLSPGFTVFNDESGDAHLTQLELAFTLASGVYLDDNNCISVGLQAGWSQNSISLGGLQWDDQYINGMYNPNAPTGETYIGNSFTYADFSAGLSWHYGNGQTNMSSNDAIKASAGAAIYHVNEPNMSYYGQNYPGTALYMKYTGYGNMEIGIPNTNLIVMPEVVYLKQGPAWEVDAGTRLRYVLNPESKYTGTHKGTALDLGIYYRVADAAIAEAGFEWGSYALLCSYDFNTSALTTASHGAGGFEISLRFLNSNPMIQQTGIGANRSMF